MAAGSGLLAQFGLAEESTVGTPVTVSRFYEVDSLVPEHQKITATSTGLRGGARGHRERNRVVTGRAATLPVPLTVFSKGFGVYLKHAFGASTIAQIAASPTWRQIHLIGDLAGKSMTLQGGFAESRTAGLVRPYTYNGCKVTNWEIGCQAENLCKATVTFDAWNWTNVTALASASYLSALEAFHFAQLSVKIGGVLTTASGRTTIAGGVNLDAVRGVALRGVNGLRTDRRFAGGAGIKSEQLENDFRQLSGELDMEFWDRTVTTDVFDSDGSTALQFIWTGATDDGSGNFPVLRFTYPKVKFEAGPPAVNGPDIVDGPMTWTAYEDDAGTHPLGQAEYESQDTAP